MQLRHIRPRSVEWYDALDWEEAKGKLELSPEEALRLRTLVAIEQATDVPLLPVHLPAGHRGPSKSLPHAA
jgi:hypothetical protein